MEVLMKTMRMIGLLLMAGVIVVAGRVRAQSDMEAAMMKAAAPGPQHQLLASFAGTWDVAVKSWGEPGKDPMTQTGTSTSQMVLGGRFLQEEVKTVGDMPFTGMGLTGYDNTKGEYFTFWIDTMGTGAMLMHGQMDASGKVMTMTGTYPDPTSKRDMTFRSVCTYDTPDHYTSVYYVVKPDGSEVKIMEMTGRRMGQPGR
jgi:hypothetical protein